MTTPETEAFLHAIGELEQALDRGREMTSRMQARIAYLREQLASGRSMREIVSAEEPPLLVQLLTESASLLHTYGTRVRRTEARAMHREGMTMDEIAHLFGVSRQRVSALLRDSGAHEPREPPPRPDDPAPRPDDPAPRPAPRPDGPEPGADDPAPRPDGPEPGPDEPAGPGR